MDIINNAYMNGDIPDQWRIVNIKPIPKSGDLTSTDNYCGISLSSVILKTYNRMILNRIRPELDPLLRNAQNGFREKRTTMGQILALRRILEGVRRKQLPAVITFIDFKKAFDSIHRAKLMKILRAYGIPERIVQAISNIYSSTKAKVISPDGETPTFDIVAGVLQGDTLAPYLFIIALDYALRQAIDGREEELGFTIIPRKSRRVPAVVATDLDFADDISLLSDSIGKAQELLHSVERECKRTGLTLNAKKTKVMALNLPDPTVKTMDGTKLEAVNDFKYLGAWMASTDRDIQVRKALAWSALHSMRKLWKSNLKAKIKRRLFVATVESVLLYGSETWTITTTQERSLNGCYTRMLRKAQNVSWQRHMNNEDLYLELECVSAKIRKRRLRLAGHCVRHPELGANQLVLWEPTQGTTARGRPSQTYIEMLKCDTDCKTTDEIRTAMMDRSVWKRFIKECPRSSPGGLER